MGTTELPGTTQPGGPGFLSIITQQLNDGVQGVSYTTTVNTSGGSGRLTTCRLISGTLPSGFTAPVISGSTCILTTNGAPVTGAPGKFTISLEAGDSSTPQRTDQRVYSITIRPRFTVNPPVILDGVSGRSYTRTFTVTTNLQNHAGPSVIGSAEAGNGPVTQCAISGLPAGFTGGASCVPDASGVNLTVSMKAGSLAAGIYPFTLRVTDSPIRSTNQTAFVAPASTETITQDLVVRQEFAVTQGTIAQAVEGRTYGAAPLAQGVTTSVVAVAPAVNAGETAELGNGPLTRCSVTVAPSGPALTAIVDPKNPSRCLLSNPGPVGAAGTYSVAVTATDSPIIDPVSGSIVVQANSETEQLVWVVAPALSYSLNFDSAAGQPGQVPDAVQNRTYGSAPKNPLVITASGGLSSTTGVSIVMGGTVPAGVACSGPTANPQPAGPTASLTCTSGANPVTAAPGVASFTVMVSDPGNTATPAGSISTDANGHSSHTLNVHPPLALAVNLADPLPPGVAGRSYGEAPAQPVLYTASGGLGSYSFVTPAMIASPGAAFPQGIACAQGSAMAATTFACSALSITASGSTTASYGPVSVTVDDTANSTTPDGVSSRTTAIVSRTLAVEPPLSITPVAGIDPPPQGVQGRTYGSGAGFAPLAYVISGGDPPYTNFILPNSISSPGSGVPSPVACREVTSGSTPPTTEVVCSSSGSNVTAIPGAYTFQLSVSDTGSAETAASSITLPPRTITLNAPLAWNGANPTSNAPPPGVQNRSYGAAGFTPLTYNATGGIGTYSFKLPPQSASPAANATPAGVSCSASSGTQVVCSSGAGHVSSASGAYSFSIGLNDTANATTPSSQTSSTGTTVNKSLTIEPPLVFSPASQTLVTAVIGRPYGQGTGCSGGNCAPIDYTLTGGLGGYQTAITPGNGVACNLQADEKTYQCSSGAILGPAGTPVLSITSTDTGNATTPSGTASGTTTTATATLPINAAMTVTPPAGALAPAVAGRTYGSGAGCSGGACQPIVFSVAGGLGGYIATPTLSGFPGSFACAFNSTGALSGTYSCFAASGVSGTSPASLSISAKDTANASAPTAQATSTPVALTIFPEITVTGPSTALPDAVAGRTYGSGSACGAAPNAACQPIKYTANGGLGNYSSSPTLDGYPGGFACEAPVNGPGPVPSASYTCLSTAGASGTGTYTVGISVADTANASTPAISAVKASNTTSLRVGQALALALSSGTPPGAVDQRAYGTGTGCTGSGGACAPVTYTISNGLGTYATPARLTTSYGFACTLPSPSSSTYQCSANPVNVIPAPSSSSVSVTLAVTASDKANASTPAGSVSNGSASVTVNPEIALVSSPTPWPDGVTGRNYAVPGNTCGALGASSCASLTITASEGLGPPYIFPGSTPSTFPAGLSCSSSSTVYTCAASPVTAASGAFSPSVTVKDSANASTPAGSQIFAGSIKVDAGLLLTSTSLGPNALLSYAYSGATPQATGGLSGYAWVAPGATQGGCGTKPTGSLPSSLTLNAATGVLSGTPDTASAKDADFTFQVCVTDTGSSTTPPGFALPQTSGNDFTVHVFNRYAYIADTGAGVIEIINTGDSANPPAPPAPPASVAQTGAGAVAVTPDGNYLITAIPGSNKFAVADTILNTPVSGSPFTFPTNPCAGPVGVVVSLDSATTYFACGTTSAIVSINLQNVTAPAAGVSVSTLAAPTAIALSPDGKYLLVTTSGLTPELLIYPTAGLSSTTTPTHASLAPGVTPVAIATAANGSKLYCYVAETKSGSPGQVEVFNVPSGTTVLGSPVTFTKVIVSGTTYYPEPTSIAVTPDAANSRVYVGLAGTDQFAIISNGATPALVGQYDLPDPAAKTATGTSSPNGVAIPPLATLPSTGYRVFFTSVNDGNGEVDIIDENNGAPKADTTQLSNFGSSSTPVGIASIPVPSAP